MADRIQSGAVENEKTSNALSENRPSPAGATDPERWIQDYGDSLFKYALMRLRDPSKAEDAVQETFLAALKGGGKFAGKSAEKTWLIGILKNKIYDYFRKSSREVPFTDLDFYQEEESARFAGDGLRKGEWIQALGPTEWTPEPGAALDNELFWKTFTDCSQKLPKKVSAVFCLREVDGVESREICQMLNISEANLWVMLHRARMALRRCLEANWFGKQEPSP
jgi:RNA polymerase sigma-70 factor (ECF subfamily)